MNVLWLPDFYEAGIAITDDPDNGSFQQFKSIYDLLIRLNLPTTRAMWAFKPVEYTGTPPLDIEFFAPALVEKDCLAYCKELHRHGFEICLHGASSGNNTRQRMIDALDFIEHEIGPVRTFICHSKNAENPYWEYKCTDSPLFSRALQMYSKNRCFGEVEGSPYFWGDYCKNRIDYVRLFRTRQVNTLAFNPAMPYHEFNKPYVNFWFSATKGYLPKLLTPQAIERLCSSNGASIVYQYLHKYVDKNGVILPEVSACLERLSTDNRLFFRPASVLLDRLRQFHMLFLIRHQGKVFLMNASRKPVDSIQLCLDPGEDIDSCFPDRVVMRGRKVTVGPFASQSMTILPIVNISLKTKFHKADFFGNIAVLKFPMGSIAANCSSQPAAIPDQCNIFQFADPSLKQLAGNQVAVCYTHPDAQRLEILQPIRHRELHRLFRGQAFITVREHVLLGRKISTDKYLHNPGKMEDPSNW